MQSPERPHSTVSQRCHRSRSFLLSLEDLQHTEGQQMAPSYVHSKPALRRPGLWLETRSAVFKMLQVEVILAEKEKVASLFKDGCFF